MNEDEIVRMRELFRAILDMTTEIIDKGLDPKGKLAVRALVKRSRGLLDRSEAGTAVPALSLLRQLIEGCATVSSSGRDITIACDGHDTKNIILKFLTGA